VTAHCVVVVVVVVVVVAVECTLLVNCPHLYVQFFLLIVFICIDPILRRHCTITLIFKNVFKNYGKSSVQPKLLGLVKGEIVMRIYTDVVVTVVPL